MIVTDELKDKLTALAFDVTDNFCYGCYKVVEGDYCPGCHSDDFMRYLDGVGVEYGTDWVVERLIKEHCSAVDAEEQFEELLSETCETVKIGSLEYDPGYALRNIDPVAFRCGVSDMLADDEQFIEVDGEHYRACDIENMIEELS
ncbi:MAG: hypothetical protein CEE38_20475 [Planctomycetes bacterium B3_Pla]|nr:MAG: hypothetical protein CEE38_20475 [Planctomycetes bacterium B3_Pla]